MKIESYALAREVASREFGRPIHWWNESGFESPEAFYVPPAWEAPEGTAIFIVRKGDGSWVEVNLSNLEVADDFLAKYGDNVVTVDE